MVGPFGEYVVHTGLKKRIVYSIEHTFYFVYGPRVDFWVEMGTRS